MLVGDGASYFSWATFFFFTIQTLGLYLERIWARVTGRKVGGVVGSVWVLVWMYFTIEPAGMGSKFRTCSFE